MAVPYNMKFLSKRILFLLFNVTRSVNATQYGNTGRLSPDSLVSNSDHERRTGTNLRTISNSAGNITSSTVTGPNSGRGNSSGNSVSVPNLNLSHLSARSGRTPPRVNSTNSTRSFEHLNQEFIAAQRSLRRRALNGSSAAGTATTTTRSSHATRSDTILSSIFNNPNRSDRNTIINSHDVDLETPFGSSANGSRSARGSGSQTARGNGSGFRFNNPAAAEISSTSGGGNTNPNGSGLDDITSSVQNLSARPRSCPPGTMTGSASAPVLPPTTSRSRLAASTITECPICCDSFNDTNRFPMVLAQCGHTFCNSCINRDHRERGFVNMTRCPECRKGNNVTRDIKRNYYALEASRIAGKLVAENEDMKEKYEQEIREKKEKEEELERKIKVLEDLNDSKRQTSDTSLGEPVPVKHTNDNPFLNSLDNHNPVDTASIVSTSYYGAASSSSDRAPSTSAVTVSSSLDFNNHGTGGINSRSSSLGFQGRQHQNLLASELSEKGRQYELEVMALELRQKLGITEALVEKQRAETQSFEMTCEALQHKLNREENKSSAMSRKIESQRNDIQSIKRNSDELTTALRREHQSQMVMMHESQEVMSARSRAAIQAAENQATAMARAEMNSLKEEANQLRLEKERLRVKENAIRVAKSEVMSERSEILNERRELLRQRTELEREKYDVERQGHELQEADLMSVQSLRSGSMTPQSAASVMDKLKSIGSLINTLEEQAHTNDSGNDVPMRNNTTTVNFNTMSPIRDVNESSLSNTPDSSALDTSYSTSNNNSPLGHGPGQGPGPVISKSSTSITGSDNHRQVSLESVPVPCSWSGLRLDKDLILDSQVSSSSSVQALLMLDHNGPNAMNVSPSNVTPVTSTTPLSINKVHLQFSNQKTPPTSPISIALPTSPGSSQVSPSSQGNAQKRSVNHHHHQPDHRPLHAPRGQRRSLPSQLAASGSLVSVLAGGQGNPTSGPTTSGDSQSHSNGVQQAVTVSSSSSSGVNGQQESVPTNIQSKSINTAPQRPAKTHREKFNNDTRKLTAADFTPTKLMVPTSSSSSSARTGNYANGSSINTSTVTPRGSGYATESAAITTSRSSSSLTSRRHYVTDSPPNTVNKSTVTPRNSCDSTTSTSSNRPEGVKPLDLSSIHKSRRDSMGNPGSMDSPPMPSNRSIRSEMNSHRSVGNNSSSVPDLTMSYSAAFGGSLIPKLRLPSRDFNSSTIDNDLQSNRSNRSTRSASDLLSERRSDSARAAIRARHDTINMFSGRHNQTNTSRK